MAEEQREPQPQAAEREPEVEHAEETPAVPTPEKLLEDILEEDRFQSTDN